MNGGNPEFFDEADKICGIVFDRAPLIVQGVLIRLGEASTVSDHVMLAREGSNLAVPSTIIGSVFHEQILPVRRCQLQHKPVSPDQDRQFEDLSAAHS